MIEVETLNAWLEKVSYKPECSLRIVANDEKIGSVGPTLHIRRHVQDACDPERPMINVVHRYAVPGNATENSDAFRNFVFQSVLAAEDHEAREWFLVNGERVHDPHRGH